MSRRRKTGGSPDGDPGDDGSPDDGGYPSRQGPPGGRPPGPQGPVGPEGLPGQIIGQSYLTGNVPPLQVKMDTSGLERTFLGMANAVERLAQQQIVSNEQLNESVREQRKEQEEGKQVLLRHCTCLPSKYLSTYPCYHTLL